jgi:hypothetical protein
MKNKTLVTTIALLTLIAFGGVSAGNAFAEPMTIALALAGAFAAAVGIVKLVKNHNNESAAVQAEAPTAEERASQDVRRTQTDTQPAVAN